MSRKTRKLIWSAPLVAVLAVAGALALFMTLAPGGVLAQDAQLGPPRELTAMADGQTMIKLSWRAPASGTAVDYRIDRAADADGSVWEEVDLSTGITILGDIGRFTDGEVADKALKPGTTYHYRVFALNDNNDEGEPTLPVSATTDPATRPAAPKTLTATRPDATETASVNRGSIVLTWLKPDVDGESGITSYTVERSANGTSGWSTLKELSITDRNLGLRSGTAADTDVPRTGGDNQDATITGYSYTDKGLMASTTWHYRVRAVNKVGVSDPSNKAMLTTTAGVVPAAATAPQVQGTDGQIILRWIAPTGDTLVGAPVTGYKIESKKTADGDNTSEWVVVVPDTRSAGTNYRAGQAIHTADTDPADTTDDAGRFRFRITPINSAGAGAALLVADTNGVRAPNSSEYGPVGSLTARAVSRTQINLSWAIPAKGGGAGTTYSVFASKDGGTTWTVSSADTSITIDPTTNTNATHTGLSAGERWTYLVFATTDTTNIHRESRLVSAATSAATPPAAPTVTVPTTGLSITATSIPLTIAANADTGGKAVTGYMIERSENQVSWETVAANFTGDEVLSQAGIQYTDKKLSAATKYYYRVRAINSVGAGEPALTGEQTTSGAAALGAPQGLVGVPKPGHNVDLYWLTPGDEAGAAITGYWIEMSEDNGANWSSVMSDTESRATTYTHERAPAGKDLLYRVQAINSVGPGPASAVEEVTTPAMAAPDAPTVTATPDSETQITVSWMEPYHGGSPITGYVLQKMMGMDYMTIAATDAATWWETLDCAGMIAAVAATRTDTPADDPMMDAFCKHYPGTPKASSEATTLSDDSKMVVDATFAANYDTITGMSYVDMGLMAGTKYSYRVAAMNDVGKSEYGMAMATTMEAMPRVSTPPTGVEVTKLLSSITVNWTPNSAQNTGTIKVVLYNESVTALATGVEAVKSFNLAAGDPGTHTFNAVPAGTYKVGVAVVDDEGMHKVHLVSEPVTITAGQ